MTSLFNTTILFLFTTVDSIFLFLMLWIVNKYYEFFNLKKNNFFSIFNWHKFFSLYFIPSPFVDRLKQKLFLVLASLFTLLLNISLGYKVYSLILAELIVIALTLDSLKVAALIFKEKKPEKEANDSETLNLRAQQSLTRDEIKSFANRLKITPIEENIKQEILMLKDHLNNINI